MSAATSYAIHPLADLIPTMSDAEYAELVQDISVNGQLQPILIYEHQVLDGRHRMRACVELGVEPRIETYEGDEPAAHVLSLNLKRRHLSTSQRAMIATDFLPHLSAEAKQRQVEHLRRGVELPLVSKETDGGRAREIAAEQVGVSHAVIGRAKRVIDNAPELAEKVRAGEMTVNAAHEIVRGRSHNEKPVEKAATGRVSARSAERIARMGAALLPAVDHLNLTKSCARLTDEERADALRACKEGLKALNALANALGR